MIEEIKAWSQGYKDYCKNVNLNPYSGKLAKVWKQGWEAAKENEQK